MNINRPYLYFMQFPLAKGQSLCIKILEKYATEPKQKMKGGGIANDKMKDSETADLINRIVDEDISGTPILEIPIQYTPIPAEWLHEAKVRKIMVRDVAGNIIKEIV